MKDRLSTSVLNEKAYFQAFEFSNHYVRDRAKACPSDMVLTPASLKHKKRTSST